MIVDDPLEQVDQLRLHYLMADQGEADRRSERLELTQKKPPVDISSFREDHSNLATPCNCLDVHKGIHAEALSHIENLDCELRRQRHEGKVNRPRTAHPLVGHN